MGDVVVGAVVLDDRLLVEELLFGLDRRGDQLHTTTLHTTTCWYYRACRAAVAGAGGHLSGPFTGLAADEQRHAISSMLELRGDIGLPDPRSLVPIMVDVALRHPTLNLLNLEAVAAATCLHATVWLSSKGAGGILHGILESEGLPWQVVNL